MFDSRSQTALLNAMGGDEKILSRHESLKSRALFLSIAIPLLGIALIGWEIDSQYPFLTGLYIPLALLSAICLLMFWAWVSGSVYDAAQIYSPISSNEESCKEILTLIQGSELARELRDAIVATGRQLYEGDLKTMKATLDNAYKALAREKAEAAHRARCAEVHGLSDTGGTLVVATPSSEKLSD
jgi:hypothetical protein